MEYNIEYTGKKIKDLLRERKSSQKELANTIGTSPANISKWLSNTMIPVDALVKIAEYLGVTVDELIYDKSDKSFNKQKIDVSFEGCVRFFAEFAKEYGLKINSYDDTYDDSKINIQGVSVCFEYEKYPFKLNSAHLKNEYMCEFLKDFSSLLNLKTDNKGLYGAIFDMWIDNQIEVANEKYQEYLECFKEESIKDITNSIIGESQDEKTDSEE